MPSLSPPWLRDGDAEKFLYTIGLGLDFLLEKQNQASRAHMPGQGTPSADPYIADDRMMVQGPAETTAQFEARLTGAFDAWARAGNRPAVLVQLQAFLANTQPAVVGMLPTCLIVGGNSAKTTWDVVYAKDAQGAPPTHIEQAPANWAWDASYRPWRSWVVLYMFRQALGISGSTASIASVSDGFVTMTGGPTGTNATSDMWITISGAANAADNGTFPITLTTPADVRYANPLSSPPDAHNGAISWSLSHYPFIGPGKVWGAPGALWGDMTRSWGLSCVPELMTSIRQIVARWKSAGAYYSNIIVAFESSGHPGDDMSPYSVIGSGNPGSTWGAGIMVANGTVVPSRVGSWPFGVVVCDGTGLAVNCTQENLT
jgi:hypothetical protein